MSAKTKASDILTDQAQWLTQVLIGQLKDTSQESKSALFHTIREHFGMLATELLIQQVIGQVVTEGWVEDEDQAEYFIVVDWKICGSQEKDQYIGPFASEQEAENFGHSVIGSPKDTPWNVERTTSLDAARKQFLDVEGS